MTTTGVAAPPTAPNLRGACTKCGHDLSGINAAVCPECGTVQAARCVGCGYDLSGLSADAVCPECAMPVQRALAGRLLVNSSPEYLASLHRGVFTILTAIIVQVLLVLMMIFGAIAAGTFGAAPPMTELENIGTFVGLAAAAALAYGWWLFSERDPAVVEGEKGERARQVVRVVVVVGLVLSALEVAVSLSTPLNAGQGQNTDLLTGAVVLLLQLLKTVLLTLLVLVLAAVKFFASMMYLRWLAPRIPDADVARKAKIYMWLLPVLTTAGALLLVGPLIALILYWNLLDVVRKRLKMIALNQKKASRHQGPACE